MFEPTSPDRGRSLDHLWRDLFKPTVDPSPARDAIDSGTAETIRQLHALGAAAPPASSRERVRRAAHASIRSANLTERTQPMDQSIILNGLPIGVEPIEPSRPNLPAPGTRGTHAPLNRGRRLWTALSVAAVIVLVLAGVWRISGMDNGGKSSRLPAVSASPISAAKATPDPATVTGVLIDTTVINSSASPIQVDIEQMDFLTGSTWDYCTGAGTFVMFMTKGAITVTSSSPSELRRGMGGAVQTAPVNQPTKISAGDSASIEPNATFHLEHAAGAPAELVSFDFFGAGQSNSCNHAGSATDLLLASGRVTLASGPLHLVARRMTLAPNETIPAPPSGVAQLAGVDPSSRGYLARSNGSYTNTEASPMVVLVLTISPLAQGAATATPAP